MNDSDKISELDIKYTLPDYKGKYGWPIYADIKQYLPDYFNPNEGWETWDMPNKSAVIFKWHDRQVSIEAQNKWLEESNAVSRRIAEEERARQENEESDRLARVAKEKYKHAQEESRRTRADAIHADQMNACKLKQEAERARREDKRVDKLVEQANEYIVTVSKLVATLRGIPAARLHEVDTDSLFFNCGRVKSILEPPRVVEMETGIQIAPIE